APADGTLEVVLAKEGDELPIGGLLARIRVAGSTEPATEVRPEPVAETAATPLAKVAQAAPPAPARPTAQPGAAAPARLLASPLAKRLGEIHAVDLARLKGSGPHGRIRKRDVLEAVEARETGPAPVTRPLAAGAEPLTPMRTQIAQSVSLSRRTIPSFVLDRWVETIAIDRARAIHGQQIEQASGIKLTFTDFLLQALADALGTQPGLLDRWQEEDGRPARIRGGSVDIGLVVSVPNGVMIPVLRDLAGKSLGAISALRQAAVQRARFGRLAAQDYDPVSISVSNIGKGGADRFEAIISPGQTAILAVGRQHEKVVARSGAIAVASGVNLTLSVDHRLIDGRDGADFLETLADRMQLGPWSAA
ncbi:MAG: 2-oxo acid dehydrogenase subunit E2, partial [Mesorhizobium sp.]|nr:2-oxo acid dehydrogenase subunit E2 [Mesorhizobium sp.]